MGREKAVVQWSTAGPPDIMEAVFCTKLVSTLQLKGLRANAVIHAADTNGPIRNMVIKTIAHIHELTLFCISNRNIKLLCALTLWRRIVGSHSSSFSVVRN